MENLDHIEKQDTYKALKAKLKKAISGKFYFEAVLIVYAILEDRSESVLRHAGGIKLTDKQGKPLKLSKKLDIIRSNPAFTGKFVRERLSLDLIEKIDAWKTQRNTIVHSMMNRRYEEDAMREFAEEGVELQRIFDNKVKSVNRYFDKEKENGISN